MSATASTCSTRGAPWPRAPRTRSARTSTWPPPTSARAPCTRTTPMADAMLELDGLEVRYGSVPAVRGLDLEVGRGEIVGLIGPNGAGKSSTLHAIMGLVPVHAGDIHAAVRSVRGRRPEAISRAGIALVP